MKEKTTLEVTLDEARELYNSHNKTLKELALKCFSENELKLPSFSKIKTFEDAVKVLGMDIDDANSIVSGIKKTSKATAAMCQLSLIRKALNLRQNLQLAKEPRYYYIYCPCNPFTNNCSTYYDDDIARGDMEIIGKVKKGCEEYIVLGGSAYNGGTAEFGDFNSYFASYYGVGNANFGFLGCASKEIAEHFGKYFGMLITEAKYGDLPDFQITERIY